MNLFASNLDKARAALRDGVSAQSLAIANLEAHRLAPADPGDAIATKAWHATDRDLAEDVEIASGVVSHWTSVVANLEREAAEKDADTQHAAAERQAKADEKVVRGALSALEKAVAEIEAVAASVARTEQHNAERGSRAFITDAETRLRQIAGRTIEARFENREFWRDGSGREPMQFRKNERGELAPIEAGFSKVRERICVQPERFIPPTMPPRLAELLPILKAALGA